MITHGSLFSGIGGVELGFHWAGIKTLWSVEINEYCNKVLERRFPNVKRFKDVTKVGAHNLKKVDVISGGFPCFPAETLVQTMYGDRPIEELHTASVVMTHKGRFRIVTKTMNRTANRILKIKTFGHPEFEVTPEHPFYVVTKYKCWNNKKRSYEYKFTEPKWVEARHLCAGHHFMIQPMDDILESSGHGYSPDFWFLVGLYLGDGWTVEYKRKTRKNSFIRKIIICCNKKHKEQTARYIEKAGLKATVAEERTVCKFHICNAKLVSFFNRFGKGASGKFIPEYCFRLPRQIQEAIFRGWLQADGYVTKTGAYQGTTVSRALALGLARLGRNAFRRPVGVYIGKVPPTTIIEGRTVNQKLQYLIRLSFAKNIGKCEGSYCYVPIRKIERTKTNKKVYNIEVQGDNSYVANTFIAHNCQNISIAGKGAGIYGDRSSLWFEMHRIISELRPKFVLVENVPALTFRGLNTVLGTLAEIGYDAEWQIVSARDVGALHLRKRIFIVAYPAGKTQVSMADPIDNGFCDKQKPRNTDEENDVRVSGEGQTMADAPNNRRPRARRTWPRGAGLENGCEDATIDISDTSSIRLQTTEQARKKKSEGEGRCEIRSGAEGLCAGIPDPAASGLQGTVRRSPEGERLAIGSEEVSYPNKEKLQGGTYTGNPSKEGTVLQKFVARQSPLGDYWAVEPNVGRVVDGISNELDETIRRLAYESSTYKKAITEVDFIRRQILRDMWHDMQSATSSSRPNKSECRNSLPKMSCIYSYERWLLGERLTHTAELRDLWQTICAKTFEEGENLLEELLIRIREKECNEKVASQRVNRVKCLGNAVVPQCAMVLGTLIREAYEKCLTRQ